MKIDQNATTVPPAPALAPVQADKGEVRVQAVLVQSQATPPTLAAGLKVSISNAGRLAASSIDAAVAEAKSPPPQTLMDGIPWPVGFGPPSWPEAQGAAGVAKLIAAQVPQVPQQNPALSKVPSGTEIAAEASRSKAAPPSAAQAQASVGAASTQAHQELRNPGATYASEAAREPSQKQKLDLRA